MVASATIHELLLFIFESVKLKKLNFWSIFMQWLKTSYSRWDLHLSTRN